MSSDLPDAVRAPEKDRRSSSSGPASSSGVVAFGYLIFGATWVLGSAAVLSFVEVDESFIEKSELEVLKGLIFVGLSAAFIRVLQKLEERRKHIVAERLQATEFHLFREKKRLDEIL